MLTLYFAIADIYCSVNNINCIMDRLIVLACFGPIFIHPARPYSWQWIMIMGAIASQITSLTIVYSTVYSGADQRKHQSSASLAFERGIHRGLVNSSHKWPVTRNCFPFDDVIIRMIIFYQLVKIRGGGGGGGGAAKNYLKIWVGTMGLEWDHRSVIFELNLVISGWSISCRISLGWMATNLVDDKSTLVK